MIDFKLDPKAGVPFYRQIIDQIKYGIASGKLQVGEQLPTVRGLAVELKVNLNTVSKAYKELEIQNILETHLGSGTFIGDSDFKITPKQKQEKLHSICREFLTIASSYGFTTTDLITELHEMQNSKNK
ncbi:GntR family transcriptional regulator [Prolixibacteraceae bacterium Z1-6]|uniref:GntR family transcriptional regulator n=1 Tax=Draconibacterium aestuarii TaxID=2998507 RepID=A0A9X3F3I7_9BACT|nr:GntR family transcriptional regulator [Prolixibacteraceae bacterium Z1-6]